MQIISITSSLLNCLNLSCRIMYKLWFLLLKKGWLVETYLYRVYSTIQYNVVLPVKETFVGLVLGTQPGSALPSRLNRDKLTIKIPKHLLASLLKRSAERFSGFCGCFECSPPPFLVIFMWCRRLCWFSIKIYNYTECLSTDLQDPLIPPHHKLQSCIYCISSTYLRLETWGDAKNSWLIAIGNFSGNV